MAERVGFYHALVSVGEVLLTVGILLVLSGLRDLSKNPHFQRALEAVK